MGLCSGQTSMFGLGLAPFCRNFFGIRSSGNVVYNAAAPGSYQASIFGVRKVGTTVTDGSSTAVLFGDAGNARNNLTLLMLRLSRVGSDIVVTILACQNTLQTANRTFADWLYSMETRNLTAIFTGYATATLGTFAVDEATNGTLDTLNVTWNSATPLVIKDIGVSVRRA